MNKFALWLIPFLVLPFLAFSGGPNAYALGHYGIGGTVADCNECHDFAGGSYGPGSGNLRWVKSTINSRTVTFTSFGLPGGIPEGTLADGDDNNLEGPCEVCHTSTAYHTNTGDTVNHYDGQNCTSVCHPHFLDDINNYFEPRFVGGQSHTTHFADPKGPQLEIERPSDYCTYFCHNAGFTEFIDGKKLDLTTVCDDCHSAGGAFDGVNDPVIGAKAKWTDGVYKENGYALQAGNENWCATCHDDGSSLVNTVAAPNVMGDNANFGYNISGHGKPVLEGGAEALCKDCHNFTVLHTDGVSRTYSAASNNYRDGYRLNEDMAVPRNGEAHPAAFKLCMNCHLYTKVIGPTSNFRDDNKGIQFHEMHLTWWPAFWASDSDFDGTYLNDSSMTCVTCHNVHGSPMEVDGAGTLGPNPVMIRHGELISTPNTTDKVPALDFKWYEAGGTIATNVLGDSRYGGLLCGTFPNVSFNHVCAGCHASGELKWFRVPGGLVDVSVTGVWTTDLNNNGKSSFSVDEDIRYHVSFEITGDNEYYVLSPGRKSRAFNTSGADWVTKLKMTTDTDPDPEEGLSAGTYEWTWDATIPSGATPGSGAKAKVQIKLKDSQGNVIAKDLKSHTFSIAP